MFTSRKVKRLQEQLQDVTDENTALHGRNQSLQKQRETLMEENKKLTQQLEATKKELEQARKQLDNLQAKVARKGCPRDEKGHFIKKEK
jgi:predicted  nucleic acid-binding Zn-ribbon protein